MVSFRLFIAATAILVAVTAAHKYHPTTMPPTTTTAPKGYYKAPVTTMPPKKSYGYGSNKGKTPAGERCAGAPNKPYVEYLGCVDGYDCVKDKLMGWGKFCKPSTPKCYKEGERCIGAPGKPYVEYMDCCGEDMWCAKDKSMGWGSFCKKMPKDYYEYVAPTAAPKKYGYGYPTAAPSPAPVNYYGQTGAVGGMTPVPATTTTGPTTTTTTGPTTTTTTGPTTTACVPPYPGAPCPYP